MKQGTLKWLNGSFIILFILSCKKEKGVLDNFPPGKFDFVYVLNDHTVNDTIVGELTGPYVKSSLYIFTVRQELTIDKSLKAFTTGSYQEILNNRFAAQVNKGGIITYEDHDSDNLKVTFESGDTLSGSLTLTRKE